ncbi:MAG: hypothetical protein AABZ44_05410 [Elusimicrobiota bacterium]
MRFDVGPKLERDIDSFKVWRTTDAKTTAAETSCVLSSAAAENLRYYHDWYKDYFTRQQQGQTFFYHVHALGPQGDVVAGSQPSWVSWRVRTPPASGTVLTPSAYRKIPLYYDSQYSSTKKLLPVNVDITTTYYIGRLYGYNKLDELTTRRRELFSRLGAWFLQLEGKAILEAEGTYLPQLAVGAEGSYMLKDTKAPGVSNPTFAFNLEQKDTSRAFHGLFLVASKDWGWLQTGVGWIEGDAPSKLIYLTEFLNNESKSDKGYFVNTRLKITRRFALSAEYLKPLQSVGAPWLLNLQLGNLLRANFDLAYLRYNRGYDILAHLNFRYTLYPSFKSKEKAK